MADVKKLINLDEDLARELNFVSNILGVSEEEIIKEALKFYFDYKEGLIADKISKRIEEGKIKVYNAEEVFKELGIK